MGMEYKENHSNAEDLSLELMEVPLSPTNYDQPPTPPGLEPPPPLVAENEIMRVLDRLRGVRQSAANHSYCKIIGNVRKYMAILIKLVNQCQLAFIIICLSCLVILCHL